MLVIRNVLSRDWLAGILTTMGISSGLIIHALLSSLGLSFIITHSVTAFEAVRFIGAAYLVFLGLQSILKKPGEIQENNSLRNDMRGELNGKWLSFKEGMLTNILNPKVAVFYLAFLPQFVNPGDPVILKTLMLAGIHVILGVVWLSAISFFLGQAREFLVNSRFIKILESTSGAILVLLGVRLALEQR